ncbi:MULTISPECIES: hypothetical protein [unclassified Saccharothrix]|uniref:hypothetical protein n=1 Tax=unclassified Saccharothrix TaxID=2593673 RepID=UPI00307CDABA
MDDDELVERLRSIANRVDPVPEWVDSAARAALTTRRMDEELAELVHDSWESAQLVRSGDDTHVLAFETDAVSVDVQAEAGGLRALVGGASGEVVVETPVGERRVGIGEDGWVVVPELPHPTVRLRLVGDDGRAVLTPWFTA